MEGLETFFKKTTFFHLYLSSSCLLSCLASSLFLSSRFSSLDLLLSFIFSLLVFSSLLFSCLFSSLLFHLPVSSLFLSRLLFSCLVLSSLFLSCLVFSCLSLSLSLLLYLLFLSLSLSVSVSVWCCVLWCCVVCGRCGRGVVVGRGVCLFVCVFVCVAARLKKKREKKPEGVLYVHTGEQWVIVGSAYQNLPTYGYQVPSEVHLRNQWIFTIFSLRIGREQHVTDSSKHSLCLIKLFSFSNPEGHCGANQL